MTRTFQTLAFAATGLTAILISTSNAQADIVGVTGSIEVVEEMPASLELHQFESSTRVPAMHESRVFLEDGVAVDFTAEQLYSGEEQLTPGEVGAGMWVDSYLLHIDPVANELVFNDGSITFDGDVLGVILLTQTLADTDPILANPDTIYSDNYWRGVELGDHSPLDWLSLSEDRRTITLHAGTDSAMDEIRILTEVPAPGAGAALFAGLALAGRRRRRVEHN
ncbi:MAG: hypothetical protein ACF8PN_00990 [Phycisphaerales bacterium]